MSEHQTITNSLGETSGYPTTLGTVLSVAAAKFGDRPALFFEGAWSSFIDLDRDSNRFADGLIKAGVEKGARVVLHVPNSRDWMIAYYGAAKAGAVVVPVDAMLTPDEVEFIINDSGATVLVSGVEDAADLNEIRNGTDLSLVILSFEAADTDGCIRQENILESGSPDFQPVAVDPEDLGSITYTSGTTGKPKGALLTHHNVLLSAAGTADGHLRSSEDVFVSALPCTHVYGNAIVHACMFVGGKLVLLRRFDSETALAAIAEHRATMFEGVPAMYFRILSHSRLHQHDVSSLRFCTVGGQTIPLETIKEVEHVFGCPLGELWGMTELGGPAIMHQLTDKTRSPAGSIGRALPGIEVRVLSGDAGKTENGDPLGELQVRGPQVMQGYLNRPEATAEVIDEDGWLSTGDFASIDETGNVFIVGRSKEIIITAGYNIYPSEVEAAIAQHPAVSMVALGKVPDPDKGEIAVAYVVLKDGHSALAGEIEQAARDVLAPYKAPRQVVFVEDLPKTGSGKIARHRLNEAVPLAPKKSTKADIPAYEFIRTEVIGHVGVVVMHGPKSVNMLNQPFITEIVDALHRFDRDPEIRCMVLRGGTNKFFSVGADINEMTDRTFQNAMDEDFFTYGWAKIAECRKPLIAAVSGLALGGGCEMSLMCDIIIASETAEFGLPEIRLGIFPGAGGTQRLTRQVGKSKAMEMILTGVINLSAEEALKLGMVSQVVPVDQLHEAALDVANKIAANSVFTVRIAKESINRAYESSLADGLLFERRAFYSTLATQDKLEGTRAFIEKREPFFEDH